MKSKKRISVCLVFAMVVGMFTGCARSGSQTALDAGASVSLSVLENSDMASFAQSEIETALKENGMEIVADEADWKIELKEIDPGLGEQAYTVSVDNKKITVIGGDENGLMYGGLEVSEQINITNSISLVETTEGTPDILKRGVRLNTPLDMRTPDYSAPGDAFQANIEDVWDIDFWKNYFDELARKRYNVFTMWTLNPMPSMVKVEEYPDIALDDVYRTTLEFDDSYSGTGNDNFRKEHLENYEVVKEITIDEKIEFWREVMAYAKSRGIEFDIYFQNVCVFGEMGMFGEPGKYGITPDIYNEVTKDYLKKSIAAMIETYPDLDGIGPVAGENMPTIPEDDPLQNDRFIWETYGQGVNEALEKDPERELLVIYTGVEIGDYWEGLTENATLCQRAGFAAQHMNADVDLMGIALGGHQSSAAKNLASGEDGDDTRTSIEDLIPDEMPIYMDIRNEDAYLLRLGDVSYIREMLTAFPQREPYTCYTLGFAGYCQAVEHGYVDEELNGGLYIDKHWYLYELVGRLGYDLELSDERVQAIFREYFEELGAEKADKLFEALTTASGIVREVNKVHYVVSSDSAFYPELAVSHSNTFGYLNAKRFMRSDTAAEGANYMSIADYIAKYAKVGAEPETDMVTPVEACQIMTEKGDAVMLIVEELEADKPEKFSSDIEREFYETLDDVKAWSYWSHYYSDKFNGAIQLGLYDKNGDESYQDAAVGYFEKALEDWKQFAEVYSSHYKAQRFGRHGYWDVNEITEYVANDIKLAETWFRVTAEENQEITGPDKKVSDVDPSEGCPYAGTYNLKANVGGRIRYFDTFEIDKNGKITGLFETSGMTGFIGQIDENGYFECEMTRMKGGTVSGYIDENYYVVGTMSARGMEVEFEGTLLY